MEVLTKQTSVFSRQKSGLFGKSNAPSHGAGPVTLLGSAGSLLFAGGSLPLLQSPPPSPLPKRTPPLWSASLVKTRAWQWRTRRCWRSAWQAAAVKSTRRFATTSTSGAGTVKCGGLYWTGQPPSRRLMRCLPRSAGRVEEVIRDVSTFNRMAHLQTSMARWMRDYGANVHSVAFRQPER